MVHFLKHLTEETLALKKLLIPPEFVSNCGKVNLTNPVVLEPTVGDVLEVEVELYEDASGFWLRNGWQELVVQYSLSHGHYLVFEYKSRSRFKLVMLGANGLNLEFPASSFVNIGPIRNQVVPEAVEEEITVNTDSVEFLGTSLAKDTNSYSNGGGGRQQAQLQSGKTRRTYVGGKRKANLVASQKNRVLLSSKRKRTDGRGKRKASLVASRKNRGEPVAKRLFGGHNTKRKENQDFVESAEAEDYVDANFMEYLGFVEEMNRNNGDDVGQPQHPQSAENASQNEFMSARKRTRVHGGENMKVNQEAPMTYGDTGSPSGRENAETSHIPSMAEQEASERPSGSRCSRPTTKTLDGFNSQPGFLKVIVTESSLANKGLLMQGGMIERHIKAWNGKMVALQVEQETWPVKITTCNGVPTLFKGWLPFVRHHSLKEGDTLTFVPTETEDLISVHILRC
ncbi:unnamed protein product [Linum tenue]|uniref:TF-B3 domain-containing protein n=1 Tax=Linum tenue TaxID=586396 RepID=A0AAV0RCC3_9ROSI|nr:unnamed protein product [Linum tenue]